MCVIVRERKRLCGGQGSQFWGTVDDTILGGRFEEVGFGVG